MSSIPALDGHSVTRAEIFFFKQKTAYEIKECDWSSDVCSSDLSTLPDCSKVAACQARWNPIELVRLQVPLAGSKSSALARMFVPSRPPATSTCPLGKSVAV